MKTRVATRLAGAHVSTETAVGERRTASETRGVEYASHPLGLDALRIAADTQIVH